MQFANARYFIREIACALMLIVPACVHASQFSWNGWTPLYENIQGRNTPTTMYWRTRFGDDGPPDPHPVVEWEIKNCGKHTQSIAYSVWCLSRTQDRGDDHATLGPGAMIHRSARFLDPGGNIQIVFVLNADNPPWSQWYVMDDSMRWRLRNAPDEPPSEHAALEWQVQNTSKQTRAFRFVVWSSGRSQDGVYNQAIFAPGQIVSYTGRFLKPEPHLEFQELVNHPK